MIIEQVKKYHLQKKGKKWIANKLGITEQEVNSLLKSSLTSGEINVNYIRAENIPDVDYSVTYATSQHFNIEEGTFKSEIILDFEPKSSEELAELHKVDLTKYKISSYWTKQRGEKFTSSLLCTLIKPGDYTAEDFANFLKEYKPPTEFTPKKPTTGKAKVDVELSIFDFHLAKKTLEGEDIEDKIEQYIQVAVDLIHKVKSIYDIDTLVFPISNDFFHSDNYQNQTTNLTPQDVLTGFDNEYEEGFGLLAAIIDYLQSEASTVEVILVQGNHDRTKSFYLAHGLEVYFRNVPSISFDRGHSVTKAVSLGNTFIGYHHGNCKIDQLPLLFSTGKDSLEFGAAKYREIHTGDKHHYMAKEIMGCRIQQMPSLSGTDRWHQDNNFVHNIRAGLALVYDKEKGKICEFESRI